MKIFAKIGVYEPSGAKVLTAKRAFPIEIGRDSECDIPLPGGNRKISRKHAKLSYKNNEFKLHDTSSNGTIHNGRKIGKGGEVFLKSRDRFTVGEYEIEVTLKQLKHVEESDFRIRLVDQFGHEQERFLISNTRLVVSDIGGRLEFAILPATDTSSRRSSGVLAEISEVDGQMDVEVRNESSGFAVTVNNHPISDGHRTLHLLDVVKVGDIRLEFVPKSDPVLKCSNSSCELLNAYDLHANCSWCGTKLAESGTVLLR